MKVLGIIIVVLGIVILNSCWFFMQYGNHIVQLLVPYVVGMVFIVTGLAISSGKRNRRDNV